MTLLRSLLGKLKLIAGRPKCFKMMNKDKILIKNWWESKGLYADRRLIQEFPNKNWKQRGTEVLLRKLQETGQCLLDPCI